MAYGKKWAWLVKNGYSDIITIDGALHNTHFADGTNPYDDIIENKEMTWGVKE